MERTVEGSLRRGLARRGVAGTLGLAIAAAIAAGCGPVGPADSGGDAIAPADAANALPTPEGLRFADPADEVEAGGLAEALGADAEALGSSGFVDAAVREWRGEDRSLTVAVGVFSSHGAALTVAGSASEDVLDRRDGRAWTPSGLPGSRGARAEGEPAERVLATAIGPNALIVSSRGDVPAAVLERSVERLSQLAEG